LVPDIDIPSKNISILEANIMDKSFGILKDIEMISNSSTSENSEE